MKGTSGGRAGASVVSLSNPGHNEQEISVLPVTKVRSAPMRASDESDVIPYQALLGERLMWKPEHRRAADRTDLRYPSDLSDGEWLIVEPMIPPAKRGGRRRSVNVRESRPAPNKNQRLTFRFSADVLPLFETSSYSTTCPSLSPLRPARSTAETWTNNCRMKARSRSGHHPPPR